MQYAKEKELKKVIQRDGKFVLEAKLLLGQKCFLFGNMTEKYLIENGFKMQIIPKEGSRSIKLFIK